MFRNFYRTGAMASAGVLLACLSGTGLAETLDQTTTAIAQAVPTAAMSSEIRFVAQPVVQDILSLPVADNQTRAGSLADLVAATPAGDLSPQLNCLAQAVYFEARGEPLDGQLAVARVIMNRAQSGRFPQDYCGVVAQPGQFSFVHSGRIPTAPTASAAWHHASAIASIAHNDLWDSAAGDSLYFHNTGVRPGWARSKATIARIDSHIFYR